MTFVGMETLTFTGTYGGDLTTLVHADFIGSGKRKRVN
jgi:hypothetical protein